MAAESLGEGLPAAVNFSGDRDSTDAICGNILGARDGVDAIPEHWLDTLELADVIDREATEAAAVFQA